MYRRVCLIVALVVIGCGSPGAEVDGGTADAPGMDDAAVGDAATGDGGAAVDAAAVDDGAVVDGDPGDGAIADAGSGADAAEPPAGAVIAPPYLMWATGTEVTVRWETADPTVGSVAYGPTSALGATATETGAVTNHELRLTGLAPGQPNYYQVGFDGYRLPVRAFSTAPPDDDTAGFRFVVWGDNQSGTATFESLVDLMIDQEPVFAISVGDTVQDGTRANFRNQLITPISPLADHVPFLVAGGNHSRYTDPSLFDEYFSQPGDEHCFGWRWGPVFFLFVDTEDSDIAPGSTQGDCITDALSSAAATEATFRVASFHKPPRIEWWVGGLLAFTDEMEAPWVREQLEPLLESYGVDLVFNGHNHLYAHTPETAGGITFVTTGGGGGAIDTDWFVWDVGNWPEIETTLHQFHFLSVEVSATAMEVTAIGASGAPIHQFSVAP